MFSLANYAYAPRGSPAPSQYLGKSQDSLGYYFQILQVGQLLRQVVIVVTAIPPEAGSLCVINRQRREQRKES